MKMFFLNTGLECPEQYDIYDEQKVHRGYVRLRWGRLTVKYPDACGKVLLDTDAFDGYGSFNNPAERKAYFKDIADLVFDEAQRNGDLQYYEKGIEVVVVPFGVPFKHQ